MKALMAESLNKPRARAQEFSVLFHKTTIFVFLHLQLCGGGVRAKHLLKASTLPHNFSKSAKKDPREKMGFTVFKIPKITDVR